MLCFLWLLSRECFCLIFSRFFMCLGVDFFVFNLFSIHWASWICAFMSFAKFGKFSAILHVFFFLPYFFSPSNDRSTSKYFTTVSRVSAYFFANFFCLYFRMGHFCCCIVTFMTVLSVFYIQLLNLSSEFFWFLMLYLLIPEFLFCCFCIVSFCWNLLSFH